MKIENQLDINIKLTNLADDFKTKKFVNPKEIIFGKK